MSAETPGVKLQFNFKMGQNLHNGYVYSTDEEEARKVLTILANLTPELTAVATLYGAVEVVKASLGATAVEQPRTQSAPTDGAKVCKHGEMKFVSRVGEKGPWKGYFCPSPKGTADQCEPQFIR
jgi:hypothetical protein